MVFSAHCVQGVSRGALPSAAWARWARSVRVAARHVWSQAGLAMREALYNLVGVWRDPANQPADQRAINHAPANEVWEESATPYLARSSNRSGRHSATSSCARGAGCARYRHTGPALAVVVAVVPASGAVPTLP